MVLLLCTFLTDKTNSVVFIKYKENKLYHKEAGDRKQRNTGRSNNE
jgi:ribosomal protein L21